MRSDSDLGALAEGSQNFRMGPWGACGAGAMPDSGVYIADFTSEEKLGAQGELFVKRDLGRIAEK